MERGAGCRPSAQLDYATCTTVPPLCCSHLQAASPTCRTRGGIQQHAHAGGLEGALQALHCCHHAVSIRLLLDDGHDDNLDGGREGGQRGRGGWAVKAGAEGQGCRWGRRKGGRSTSRQQAGQEGGSDASSMLPRRHPARACTWMGARRGGRRRPASSPCVMMMPPTMRVLTPQLLWCTYCRAGEDKGGREMG